MCARWMFRRPTIILPRKGKPSRLPMRKIPTIPGCANFWMRNHTNLHSNRSSWRPIRRLNARARRRSRCVYCAETRRTASRPIKGASMLARVLLIAGLLAAFSQTALAQFYKGKTITMIINYPAGGHSDIEGRIVAQHLPAHIPGRRTIVIKNVGGAGGVIGANQLGEAPANGENMGFF